MMNSLECTMTILSGRRGLVASLEYDVLPVSLGCMTLVQIRNLLTPTDSRYGTPK